MKFKIITDSASDLKKDYLKGKDIAFETVPLTINIGDKEFVDDEKLDINEMLNAMHEFGGKTSTACPSPETFKKACEGAEYYFIITITSGLSGTYNSARLSAEGKDNIFVIDSKSTCGSEILIVNELVRLIENGESFEDISVKILEYRDSLNLLFVLQRFDNLVANGRMSKFAGFMAKTLQIRPICEASKEGTIEIKQKLVGSKNALHKLVEMIEKKVTTPKDKTYYIAHCDGEEEANLVGNLIKEKYGVEEKSIHIYKMAGLASYYALEKGIIVCF